MRFQLITFDVYSALFDLETSLGPRLARALETPEEERARTLLREWRRLQLEYTLIATLLQQGHPSFRVVTRRALDTALHRVGISLPDEARASLVQAWDELTPWPEASEVLRALRARGYPIAVLSNGDEAMLRAVTRGLGVPFDHVFAADRAGVYKPHPRIYRQPLEALGLRGEEVLHVAGSARDVMGARAAGLYCAWVNRTGDRVLDPTYAANYECRDLHGVLDVV